MHEPILFLIRHGEKPPKLQDGEDQVGLSQTGVKRADYLPQVFGRDSPYNIQYILAEQPKKHEKHARPYETVVPLAESLNLQIDSSIERDDVHAVAKAAKSWTGPGNVLICWEHHELSLIAKAIGIEGYAPETGWSGEVVYPDDRFDLIWTVPPPYNLITSVASEQVPGLDDGLNGLPIASASRE